LSVAESPVLLVGVVLGAALLCAGILVGALLAARTRAHTTDLEPKQVLEFLRGLVEWTSGVSLEMAEYRQLVDGVARDLDGPQRKSPDVGGPRWLDTLTTANQRLKHRLEEAEAALKQQSTELAAYVSAASTDPLTALPNRRIFDQELKRRFAEWRRQGTPFAVLLIDIDHFKQFNDRYGHLVGDLVLKQVGRVLTQTMRETDLVARFGGEEFVVVLPSSGAQEARRAAERARAAIDRLMMEHDGRQLRVSVSCGAAHTTTEDTPERLVERADSALYAAKDAGRNRAFAHDGRKCMPAMPGDAPPDPPATPVQEPQSVGAVAPEVEQDCQQACHDLQQRLDEVLRASDLS
jgi:diguanylate cyclase